MNRRRGGGDALGEAAAAAELVGRGTIRERLCLLRCCSTQGVEGSPPILGKLVLLGGAGQRRLATASRLQLVHHAEEPSQGCCRLKQDLLMSGLPLRLEAFATAVRGGRVGGGRSEDVRSRAEDAIKVEVSFLELLNPSPFAGIVPG